ncbi:MAG: hypothetical protein IT324_09190, partial [Anaerolineae bacterium]|nr:hypothetical protein [Anaerolineae bacterium]
MKLELDAPSPYDFARSVRDHGWIALAPCRWIEEQEALERVERLADGMVVVVYITAAAAGQTVKLQIDVRTDVPLSTRQQDEIRRNVRWMLKLDEDFTPFYEFCQSKNGAWDKIGVGRGRLLRSPTLFEDVV